MVLSVRSRLPQRASSAPICRMLASSSASSALRLNWPKASERACSSARSWALSSAMRARRSRAARMSDSIIIPPSSSAGIVYTGSFHFIRIFQSMIASDAHILTADPKQDGRIRRDDPNGAPRGGRNIEMPSLRCDAHMFYFLGSSAGGVINRVSGAAGLFEKNSPVGVCSQYLLPEMLSDTYILIFCAPCDIIN